MSTFNWPDALTDPQEIFNLFDRPPSLSECALFYFHIDERGTSVTLGFDTREIPDRPLPEWQGGEFNAYEFFLTFSKVSKLQISGWDDTRGNSVKLSKIQSGGIQVTISSEGGSTYFRSECVDLSRSRVYLASSIE